MENQQQHRRANHSGHLDLVLQPGSPSRCISPSTSPSRDPHENGSPSSTTSMGWINAGHYQILMNGNIDAVKKEILSQDIMLSNLVTEFDQSSVLHIAAMAEQDDLIAFIVEQFNRDDSQLGHQHLLLRPNKRGDLPVHVAARAGKGRSVSRLVECAGSGVLLHQMLEARNKDGNTALNVALENQQEVMANHLLEKCPHTFYPLNEQGISPLYLAIKAGLWKLVKAMLQIDVEDPSDVENQLNEAKVVHAAIMAKEPEILKIMLEKYPDLMYSRDEQLRRPLSYAAFTGFLEGVKYMLTGDRFRNMAFRADDDGSFPIHRACSGGNRKVVKEFLTHSSSMMWLLNQKGQNILHVAAESGKAKVVNYILGLPRSDSLINMKDEDGNTPLHLASRAKHPKVVYALTWDHRVKFGLQNKQQLTALDMAEDHGQVPSFEERLTWLALRYAGVPRAPQIHLTPQAMNQLNPLQAINIQSPSRISSGFMDHMTPSNKYKERLSTLLVVSTLVATVNFASGLTVPGGYNQADPNVGMATLSHRCAFQVFVISNTIALFSSILAMVTLIWAHLDDLRLILLSLDFVLPLLAIALTMMSVAFMAGLYVVLHTLLWLGIVVVVMGGVFLGFVLILFIPLYSPTSPIKSKFLRCLFHVPFKLMLLACEKGKSENLH